MRDGESELLDQLTRKQAKLSRLVVTVQTRKRIHVYSEPCKFFELKQGAKALLQFVDGNPMWVVRPPYQYECVTVEEYERETAKLKQQEKEAA